MENFLIKFNFTFYKFFYGTINKMISWEKEVNSKFPKHAKTFCKKN